MRAWIVWGIGVLAYVMVILDGTMFGVSGMDAAARFGASPTVLSWFVVLPAIAYSGMQIPAGLLLDRFGARTMIATGVTVISAGQLTLALTRWLPTAIGAYGLVGLGGSTVFISVIRLLPNWFTASRVPLLTQLTGFGGQLGQLLSAIPFLVILLRSGWTAAFASTAALGALSVMLTLAFVRDTPSGHRVACPPRTLRTALGDVRTVWSRPGTRLGFFTHMGAHSSISVFALMWGVPYLTTAQGMARRTAGALLAASVVAFVVSGVLVGIASARHPQRRPAMALTMIGAAAAIWTVVLMLPSRAPVWLLVLLVVVISIGQSVAMVAFDFARSFNPAATLGTAEGVVATGSPLAVLLVMQAMGVIIGAAGGYSFDAFRLAWTTQYAVWAVAAVGVVAASRKARHAEGFSPSP